MIQRVIRKNRMTFQATFIPPQGSTVAASAAHLTLVYKDRSGGQHTDNIALILANGVWSGSWDTSNVKSGERVEWMAWCEGQLQAATQGSFLVEGNAANDAV